MFITIRENYPHFDGPRDAAKIAREAYEKYNEQWPEDAGKERFLIMGIDGRNRVKYLYFASLGTLDACMIDPRGAFKVAIVKHVNALMLVHNHPSGVMKPSDDDQRVIKHLAKAGEILGIRILDALIIADDKTEKPYNYYSFAEHNLI